MEKENEDENELKYKILFLGETQVGKTSLIIKYTESTFQQGGITTLGVDLKYKYLKKDNKNLRLDLWDTAGQERFRNIAKSFYNGANGIIFIFDLASSESFDKLKFWIEDSKDKITDNNIELLMVGNKSDLIDERVVTKEKIQKLSEQYNIPYFETSAKIGEGIEEMFNTLINKLLLRKEIRQNNDDDETKNYNNSITLKPPKSKGNQKNKKCSNNC